MPVLPLWKRCRVLANRLRLEMLELLVQNPPWCVKKIALKLGIAEEVASKNLQLLAAAGFLAQNRVGKYLYYTAAKDDALLSGVISEKAGKEELVHTVTALTHERRVLIISELNGRPMTLEALFWRTGISGGAMRRQLEKLERRNFVRLNNGRYCLTRPDSQLGRQIMEMALKDSTPAQV
jgi:DNA-binding IclR family transcriptional regulator